MMILEIEPQTPASVDLLAALHGRVFPEPWPASAFAALLAIPGTFALLLRQEDGPAGFVVARVIAGEAEIITLGMLPAWQRRGGGGCLLRAACDKVRAGGAAALFLEVAARNAAARQLYDRFGFVEVGRRKSYYAGPVPDDAVVLRLDLASGLRPALDDNGVRS